MTETNADAGRSATPVLVAIDGPSGVGKSTAARRLSRRLGVPYLDTGAMYRAVALHVLDRGISPDDEEAVVAAAGEVDLGLELDPESGGARVLLLGEPVEERLRTTRVGEASSRISTYSEVRRRLVALQQEFARRHGGVLEGRDIGTRVFPDTPHKFFLDARQEVRYRRRFEQLAEAGSDVTYSEVVVEIDRRDQRDSHRHESPLTYDDTYTLIDTSDLTADEVVDRMEATVRGAG
ncbi:MAG TPA: (d)CMP kinase [Thermoanaerobaculia bacterium]|nr:(d)CMP kinase [Thermoanaerobaculia bacterium]